MEQPSGPQHIIVVNQKLLMQLQAVVKNADQDTVFLVAQPDGTLRVFALQVGQDGGVEAVFATESDGTQKISNYGKVGMTLTAFALDTGGESKNVLYGKDRSDGTTITAAKVNDADQDQLIIQPLEHWVQIDPVLLTTGDTIIYNPGAAASELYLVELLIVNITASDATATIYQDIGAGGTAGNNEYWVNTYNVPARSDSGWLGPFLLPGDDDIRGLAGTTTALNVQWRIRRTK